MMTEAQSAPSEAVHPRAHTHCPYCALQCGMVVVDGDDGATIEARDFPTNRGGLCRKGWTATEVLRAPDRLLHPLMRARRGAPLRPVSWAQALGYVADMLAGIQRQHGADAVGIYGGGGLTNEKAYALGKFARVVLKTRHIDYNGRFCMAAAAVAAQRAFGLDRGLPFPLADLGRADVLLLAGANPAETMPPMMQYFDEQRDRGGRLLVIDPRRTATAERAGLHLQLTPGTDAALANGLLYLLLRDHHVDLDYIAARTSGFERVRHTAMRYWPDRVERMTGVPARKLEAAASVLADGDRVIGLTARGAEQQSQGVDNVLAYINVLLALGKVGVEGSGYGCLTGQGNGQGGREHGQKADQLPGYRKLDDALDRAAVAAVWNVPPQSLPPSGPSACEMFARMGEPDGVRALLVMGANPVVSAPDAQAVEARLAALDLLVVADIVPSETARMADVVLPVCQWAEEEGTMTNLEGRLLHRTPALAPPPDTRTDLAVLKALADGLGGGHHLSESAEVTFDELRRASAGGRADYAGMGYARLRRGEALYWPCPSSGHPGTPRLFLERFATDDGRARFFPIEQLPPPEDVDEAYPLFLTTGRLLSHYQTGSQTRRVPSLMAAEPEPMLELHPETGRRHGIADGDLVHVDTRRGSALFTARFTPSMRLDTVFVPFHFPDGRCANRLTIAALDPASKIPAFKLCAATIRRANTPPASASTGP